MKKNQFQIFLIGLGGVSMSGLAKLLLDEKFKVLGSDTGDSAVLQELKSKGVKIYRSHKATNITSNINLVVFSGAIKKDNPEILQAKKLNIPVLERSEFLGVISKEYKHLIAVSGTHGKTTTTAMIGEIFILSGLNPTIHLGGTSVNLKTNTYIGDKDYLIIEACEYRNSFRYLKPETAVITNIECDHLDYYRNLSHITKCFASFAKKSKSVIKNYTVNIKHNKLINISQDFYAKDIKFKNFGYEYDVYKLGQFYASFRLNMIGLHNVENSLFAIAVADKYNIPKDIIKDAISNFNGVERRYEKIAEISGIPIIIDYAHHPTEIAKSIDGIMQVYNNPLVIFQPHTYTRTLALFDGFINVLKTVKNLILYPTYPAREKELKGGKSEDLYNRLKDISNCKFINDISAVTEEINEQTFTQNIDAVLILGAGNLAEQAKKLLKS